MHLHPILPLALAASLFPAARAAETPLYFGLETPDIPVVHTGSELQKLKSLTEDRPLRIGIECNQCQLGEGTLIYIAPDPHARSLPKTHFDDWQHSEAGPVSIEVRRILAPGEREHPRDRLEQLIKRDQEMERSDVKNPLFFAAVQPPEAGKYEIRVSSADGNLLAKTTLTVSDKPAQPWFGLEAESINPKSKKPFKAHLTGGLVRPKWPDYGVEIPSGDLPHLIPDAPTPGYEITAAGNVLTVSSKFSMTNDTEDNFFVRFWVNDKPVTALDELDQEASSDSRAVEEFKPPFKFKLAIDLTHLNAKPGDRITVQLAYSPWGVEAIQLADLARELADKAAFQDSGQLLVSNKTTFILPAPKAKIQN